MIEIIPITSREQWLNARHKDVTASVCAALLGVHPYLTAYELWAMKTNRLPALDEQLPIITASSITLPPMLRGINLETNALALLNQLRPDWTGVATDGQSYYRDTIRRIGATPDAIRIDPTRPNCHGIVQVKTVSEHAFRNGEWRDLDTGETTIPTWIAVQAIVEAELTGASWACVAALVLGANVTLHIVDVPLNNGVMAKIYGTVAEFWSMIDAGREPRPDYSRDIDAIKSIYRDDDGATIDLTDNIRIAQILGQREALKLIEADGSKAERKRKIIDAEILHTLGNASTGIFNDGQIIRAPVTKRSGFTVAPSQFRTITIKQGT